MRTPTLSMTSFLLFAAMATAQTNPPPVTLNPQGQAGGLQALPVAKAAVPLDPANSRLDAVLLQWEQRMKSITQFDADISRSETDPVTKTTEVFQGKAQFMRPDRAKLYLQKTTNPQIYEHYVFTGTYLYDYRPQSKLVRIYEIAPPLPGKAVFDDNNFLNLLTGMKAADAKERFEISLLKEDEHYVYLKVAPKLPSDKQEFAEARFALLKATFLPRELQFVAPNGSVIKWDIPKLDDKNARLTTANFDPPPAAKDWKIERVPRDKPTSPTGTPTAQPQPQPSKFRPAGQ